MNKFIFAIALPLFSNETNIAFIIIMIIISLSFQVHILRAKSDKQKLQDYLRKENINKQHTL